MMSSARALLRDIRHAQRPRRFYASTTRPHLVPAARQQMLQDGGVDAYPRVQRKDEALGFKDYQQTYSKLACNERLQTEAVTIRGRIRSIRDVSSKLIFYTLQSSYTTLQAVANLQNFPEDTSKDDFIAQSRTSRIGDIVEVTGFPGKSKSDELSIFATEHIKILAPCLHNLPERLENIETRLHQRHLDLLVNPSAAQILRLRSRLIDSLRQYFLSKDFVEVSTPILSTSAGGALARPFLTEAGALHKQLALRIAPELWLKQLVIGGMDRVFEIGPQFRNEGIDATHNPEFSTCEFYAAYAGLDQLMQMTIEILQDLTHKAIDLRLKSAGDQLLRLAPEVAAMADAGCYKVVEFIPALEKALGQALPVLDARPAFEVIADLMDIYEKHSIPLPPSHTVAKLLDKLASHVLEPTFKGPTFLMYHPEALSPLSKSAVQDINGVSRRVACRFELFCAGKEIVNAYEEENDPKEQKQKFAKQSGDDGALSKDEAFVEALEWGLPPTAGWGMGIERMIMMMAGVDRIGEVMAFGGIKGAVNKGDEQ